MIQPVVITFWWCEGHFLAYFVSSEIISILGCVPFFKLLFSFCRKAFIRVITAITRCRLAFQGTVGKFIPSNINNAFSAHQFDAEATFAFAICEVDTGRNLEGLVLWRFRIIHQRIHHIVCIPAVFPHFEVAQAEDLIGTQRTGDDMDTGEEVHDEVSCGSCSIVFVVSPTKKARGVERYFGGITEEAVEVNGFG